MLFVLGVDEIKGKILSGLKIFTPGPGYCHFPLSADIDDENKRGYTSEYFKGLVSERRTMKFKKGYRKYEWEKKAGVRNEPLDCRVYARAALAILNPNLDALRKMRDRKHSPTKKNPTETTKSAVVGARNTKRRRGQGSKGVSA